MTPDPLPSEEPTPNSLPVKDGRRNGRFSGPWQVRDRWIADLTARGVHQRWILFAGLAGMFANTFTFTVLAVSLKSIAAETTNVTNGASFVYPYNDATKTYAPENLATFPEPAGDFEGLSNFAHA